MKKIIFDTDIGEDCDDAGALSILDEAVKSGICELLGVTISTRNLYGAGTAFAINESNGVSCPIGETDREPLGQKGRSFEGNYGKGICDEFGDKFAGKRPEYSVRLLRRLLAESDEKVSIVVVGSSINIAGLLESEKDDISELSGYELVKEKVEMISIMAGLFAPEKMNGNIGPEYNVMIDIPAAKKVFEEAPVPIVVSPFEEGYYVNTGKALIEKRNGSPAAECYRILTGGQPRCSWDPISAFYAVYGCEDILELSEAGKVSVDEKGITKFEPAPDGNARIIHCRSFEETAKRIDIAMIGG